MNQKTITIVVFHSITNEPEQFSISKHAFSRQITFIKDNYEIIRLRDIKKAFAVRTKKQRVVLTFDDAYKNFLENAFPFLETHRIPSINFVPTGYIGKDNEWDRLKEGRQVRSIMNKVEIRKLNETGLVDFGSHTIDHVRMKNLDPAEMRRQIIRSQKDLEDLLGKPVRMFSYPHGQLDDFSRTTTNILREARYDIALTTHWGTLNSDKDRLKLKRISFKENDDLQDIRSKIEGEYDWFAFKERLCFTLRRVRELVRW